MARLITTSRVWFLKEVESCLSSMGIALLVVSVLLVPASGLRADEGDPPGDPAPCDQATCDNGCKLNAAGSSCTGTRPRGYDVCNSGGCASCPCLGCFYGTGGICDCNCQLSKGTCSTTTNKCF
jgi:hypothetical protein